MKLFKTKKQKLKEECYSLDYYLIKWINEHFKQYKEDASKWVDLTYHKYKYLGKEYTQLELIDEIIKITDFLLNDTGYECDYFTFNKKYAKECRIKVNKMYDILKLIHWSMWW